MDYTGLIEFLRGRNSVTEMMAVTKRKKLFAHPNNTVSAKLLVLKLYNCLGSYALTIR